MTRRFTVIFEADDNYKEDPAAALVVFDDDHMCMLHGFSGEQAVELYEKLERQNDVQ